MNFADCDALERSFWRRFRFFLKQIKKYFDKKIYYFITSVVKLKIIMIIIITSSFTIINKNQKNCYSKLLLFLQIHLFIWNFFIFMVRWLICWCYCCWNYAWCSKIHSFKRRTQFSWSLQQSEKIIKIIIIISKNNNTVSYFLSVLLIVSLNDKKQ